MRFTLILLHYVGDSMGLIANFVLYKRGDMCPSVWYGSKIIMIIGYDIAVLSYTFLGLIYMGLLVKVTRHINDIREDRLGLDEQGKLTSHLSGCQLVCRKISMWIVILMVIFPVFFSTFYK